MQKALKTILFGLVPFLLFSNDTIPVSDMEKAIRIEYSLVLPKYDSMLNYASLYHKKILTIKEGEVLYEKIAKEIGVRDIRYYDLHDDAYYAGFASYNPDIGLWKGKIRKPYKVIASSKKAAHKVLGKPCRAFQIASEKDTLLVFVTDEFGADFFQHADIKGIALEYEETILGNISNGKIKYRATKIDTVYLPDKKLVDISSFNSVSYTHLTLPTKA